MNLSISRGNTKLGNIPNISLPPGLSCRKDAPCSKECYAMKAWRMHPPVRSAWSNNFNTWNEEPVKFEEYIIKYLDNRKPEMFRWHTAGDIPSQEYYSMMVRVADRFPDTKFLAFTKQYELDFSTIPSNLSIVFSAWPNFPLPKKAKDFPIAFMQDGTETRVDNAIECHKKCDECKVCWSLKELGKNVLMFKH